MMSYTDLQQKPGVNPGDREGYVTLTSNKSRGWTQVIVKGTQYINKVLPIPRYNSEIENRYCNSMYFMYMYLFL